MKRKNAAVCVTTASVSDSLFRSIFHEPPPGTLHCAWDIFFGVVRAEKVGSFFLCQEYCGLKTRVVCEHLQIAHLPGFYQLLDEIKYNPLSGTTFGTQVAQMSLALSGQYVMYQLMDRLFAARRQQKDRMSPHVLNSSGLKKKAFSSLRRK